MRKLLAFIVLVAFAGAAPAQSPWRVRGSVVSVDGDSILVRERDGQYVRLALTERLLLQEVLPIRPDAIKPGAFVGTAALSQADGTLRSLEVVVFPEAGRGSGEGHYPWDLHAGSTMTNATVAELVASPDGRRLLLRYKGGEKTVVVPDGVPVVTFAPGERALVVPSARVFAVVEVRDGALVATRLVVGRNGFAPPM